MPWHVPASRGPQSLRTKLKARARDNICYKMNFALAPRRDNDGNVGNTGNFRQIPLNLCDVDTLAANFKRMVIASGEHDEAVRIDGCQILAAEDAHTVGILAKTLGRHICIPPVACGEVRELR